jgi:hypothetical protein
MTSSRGGLPHISAAAVITIWSSSALAKLPAGVEAGFHKLLLTIVVLLSLSIASMVVGAALAKKLAPNSRDLRQLITSLVTLLGVGVGATVFLLR